MIAIWRVNMRIFGNADDLPEEIEVKINALIKKIEQIDYLGEISMYYGYPFIELDGKETIMKSCIICSKGIISIYADEQEMKVYQRHLTKMLMESSELSNLLWGNANILHAVHIDSPENVLSLLQNSKDCLTERNYREINAIIQNIYGLNHTDDREIQNENTLGALIKGRNNEINMLDQEQFETIYKKTTTHTRIRGLAGSGKTILLVKKMAYMHYKNRDLELVYVFYTKSLKQYIKDLFVNFYKDFEKYKEPDMSKIHILHSWGGNEMEGFYSRACKENNIAREGYNDVSGSNKFDKVCKNLLNKLGGKGKKLYDYIFVDEAQDFPDSFFELCQLVASEQVILASDIFQEIFKRKSKTIQKPDFTLNKVYRTDPRNFMFSQFLGFGIKDKPIIKWLEDDAWKTSGYTIKKDEEGKNQFYSFSREPLNRFSDMQVSPCT